MKGIISAGHPKTVEAAETILKSGGNAFDAALAALYTSCVVEPVLSSLGGGGFLLAKTQQEKIITYDFFTQSPITKKPISEIDFYPIIANFGSDQQEFHIGLGSIATPGMVKGIFEIHRDLCQLPMNVITQPAIEYAKKGVILNKLQAYIFDIVKPIYTATDSCRKNYSNNLYQLPKMGDCLTFPNLAETFEWLSKEGDQLFYQHDIAKMMVKDCQENGGYLKQQDLTNYQVYKRPPLTINYRNHHIYTNPPPSSGGILIAFALKLAEKIDFSSMKFGSKSHLDLLAQIMLLTNQARLDAPNAHHDLINILDPKLLSDYIHKIKGRTAFHRGTTHINVIDRQGNIASLTSSNGEGCGSMLGNTGIMLNNMLGEADLNPEGFHQWQPNQRLTSMMAPSYVKLSNNQQIALGSGGSNRIRTAILQVLINIIDFNMDIQTAVKQPRIHHENNLLSIETGFPQSSLDYLYSQYHQHVLWPEQNLFFGGTHTLSKQGDDFTGVGDARRDGVFKLVD